jgi:hypothetical protein
MFVNAAVRTEGFHIANTHRVFLLCELFHAFQGKGKWRLSHTADTHEASLHCEFFDVSEGNWMQ